MEEIKIAAEIRNGKGTKKVLSTIRAEAKIPGVIYGGAKPPVTVMLLEKDLMTARKKGGVNAILHMELGKSAETVIVKELQRHPVTDRPVHADFQRISLTEKIDAKVPLHVVGEAPGVKVDGGVLQHELREITVRALPTKIPQSIDVDVSALGMGHHVLVKDLKVPADVLVLDAADHIVVHVTQVKIEEAAPVPGAAVPGTEGAAGTAAVPAAEPESSSTKGKKDEEGKVIPKAAAAAPAEKGKEGAKKESK